MRPKEILKTLDSDDEFPDEYNEAAAIPDYLYDSRFNKIEFKWIEKDHTKTEKTKVSSNKNNLIVKNGVMNEQDLYCLKIIANCCPNILVWYTNFTIYKDLQSSYNYLRSCLVITSL